MYAASAVLAVIAIALAWPVPIALARASWPSRTPGRALALWQLIALAGGTSMIGALLLFGFAPFVGAGAADAGLLVSGLFSGPLPTDVGVVHIVALGAAVLLGAHLLLNLATTAVRAERSRRRHHTLVELLSSPVPGRPGTRMLDHAAPVAYCLPGMHTVTVLSEGLVDLLDREQLDAVLAHERTHLRQHHHLVLLAFTAWNSALPWFPIANRAERAVALLVEMLADDTARREVDAATLATAIALVGSAWGDVGHADVLGTAPHRLAAPGPTPAAPHEGPAVAGALGARISRLLAA
ncbi:MULTISPECIES: M56 family metallopeptidase [unclassified Leifsonia]|uniref:M56 family metallopeptidase n=1 Tax=unclassified Leifsonia TaxID=2663824 RepID=UPI0006FCAB08|nr:MULTISPECIES: M56 family metallopeptidase [unclassified Leifsonia]KQX07116.1 hypothetical protein ASC59_04735 [Leifsonia sp. Root1293]KRA11399.1 hypothetical protein ASD61_04735 [Leifsonia sp. Root60]